MLWKGTCGKEKTFIGVNDLIRKVQQLYKTLQDFVVLNILTILISEVKLLSGKNGGKQK